MKARAQILAALARLGALADDAIEIAEGALLLAAVGRPHRSLEPYRRHLARLAQDVAGYAGGAATVEARAEALGRIVAKRYGYGGEEDAAAEEAADLTRVIDRRCGPAESLGILYLQVARALGWAAAGIDFPARLLVRLDHLGRRAILDPFAGGRVLRPEDLRGLLKAAAGNHAELRRAHYRTVGNREILLRLGSAIKAGLLRRERLAEALAVVEAMLLLAPAASALWREAGLLHARLDNVQAAVAALEEYLRRAPADAGRQRTSMLLQELRGRLG